MRLNNKIVNWLSCGLAVVVLAFGLGCGGSGGSSSGGGDNGAEGYQYWTGALPCSYYLLDFDGNRALKVTGKPFLVLTYDKISLDITDCEFGLSEVTQVGIIQGSGVIEPTFDAATIDFHEKLGLQGPVVRCVSWGSKSIVNGAQNFSFTANPAIGTGPNSEKWIFTYLSWTMSGGVTNRDTNYFSGRESETNAFSLSKL